MLASAFLPFLFHILSGAAILRFSQLRMILGQIAYVDCIAFLVFLIPQLLLRVSIFELLVVGLKALPFLCKIYKVSPPVQCLIDSQ